MNDGWVSLHDLHLLHSHAVDREMNRGGYGFYEWLMRSPDASAWTEADE